MGTSMCPAVSQTTDDYRMNMPRDLQRQQKNIPESPHRRQNKPPINKATKEDFHFIKVVGQGSYGKVYLVKHKRNERHLAMKVIKKELVFRTY